MSPLSGVVTEILGATAKKSSSSVVPLVILIAVVAAGYFFFLRPQQQRQRQQRAQRSDVELGDEVLTVGGIVGRVVDIQGDRITIVSGADADANGTSRGTPTRLVMVKQGIARKIEPLVADDEDEDHEHEYDEDHDHDDHDHEDPDHDHLDDATFDGHGADEHEDGGDEGSSKGTRGR